jgi:hypothetical protein
MMNPETGEINKAVRVRDNHNNRIHIYEVEHRDILDDHFIIMVDK